MNAYIVTCGRCGTSYEESDPGVTRIFGEWCCMTWTPATPGSWPSWKDSSMASELAAALAKVQAELRPIARTAEGQAGTRKHKYADLAAVSAEVLPLLGKHGLAFMSKPTVIDGKFVLAYSLLHSSGEREDGTYPLPDKGTPQQLGGHITYARRYTLCAITGAAPEGEDDDGAAASQAKQPSRGQRERPPQRPPAGTCRANQDGSLAHARRPPDEELAAAGVMSSSQQKEHTELRKGAAKGKEPRAEHLNGHDPDDLWASDLPLEERPGSIDPERQMPQLQAAFSRLFARDERDQRLHAAEQIIGRELTGPHKGRTSKNLSQVEARKLIDTLDGLSREQLIERMALATGSAT